jgi:hypothetical protein
MLKSNQYLGGRLPLLDPKVLSSDQRDLYQRLGKTMISWAMATGFQGKTEDGCLIGPFNPILYSPGISTAFMDLHDEEEAHTSIDEQVRQVVILGRIRVGHGLRALRACRGGKKSRPVRRRNCGPFSGAQASEPQRRGPYRCELRT